MHHPLRADEPQHREVVIGIGCGGAQCLGGKAHRTGDIAHQQIDAEPRRQAAAVIRRRHPRDLIGGTLFHRQRPS
jgi:hypothetical protein